MMLYIAHCVNKQCPQFEKESEVNWMVKGRLIIVPDKVVCGTCGYMCYVKKKKCNNGVVPHTGGVKKKAKRFK